MSSIIDDDLKKRGYTQPQIDAAFSPENCAWPDHEKEFMAMSTHDQLRMIGSNAGFMLWVEEQRTKGVIPPGQWGEDFDPFTCPLP
jgi:hypothetical protein